MDHLLQAQRRLVRNILTSLLRLNSAEVIKIEHPTRGDDTRAWGPPYAKYTAESKKQGPGEAAYYLAVRPFVSHLLRQTNVEY